jgi:beta-galactosidase
MKKTITPISTLALVLFTIFTCGVLSVSAQAYTPPSSNHTDFNFNYDWLFIKQNVSGGAAGVSYNESSMTAVNLPHTWSDDRFREWVFDSNDTAADPLRPGGSYVGIAWYRKHFTIPTTYSGRQIILEFQGVTYIPTVYVNGTEVGFTESGWGPSGFDITPYVTFGSDNVIAVEVNNNSLYATVGYGGDTLPAGPPFCVNYGGINRDVTLHITDKVHLTKPLYRNLGTQGTYIYPTGINTLTKACTLNIQAEVKNDNTTSQTVTCSSVVVDATGTVVQTIAEGSQAIAAGKTFVFNGTGSMTGIHFWDPTYPYLYQVYTELTVGGNVVDVDEVTTGIRTYVFNPNFGLEVNGHYVYLNGYAPRASMEWPAVGTPVDWMNEYDFQQMKASNANFCRPMQCTPVLTQVQAADKYGIIMVVPSAYTEDDQPDPEKWQQDLDLMRDITIYFRNDPSVLFYEACNGEPTAQHMTDMLNVRKTWDPNGGRRCPYQRYGYDPGYS